MVKTTAAAAAAAAAAVVDVSATVDAGDVPAPEDATAKANNLLAPALSAALSDPSLYEYIMEGYIMEGA